MASPNSKETLAEAIEAWTCPFCKSAIIHDPEATTYRCTSPDCKWWIFERDIRRQ